MSTILPLSDRYREAIVFSLAILAPAAIIFALLLDGGRLSLIAGYAMIGFWLGVAVVLLRRPLAPQATDLAYIRYGYLPLVYVACLCAAALAR
jgi:hypothetical protein